MITLTSGDVAMVVSLVAFVVSIIGVVIVAVKSGKPQQIDSGVAARFEERQKDREWVERMERAYQQADQSKQAALDTVTGVLRFVSRMTPIKTDDAALALLEDIRKPGAPNLDEGQPAG